MKVIATLLACSLLTCPLVSRADGSDSTEKRMERAETRTRADGRETRERQRLEVEKRTEHKNAAKRSGHRDGTGPRESRRHGKSGRDAS